MKAKKRSFSLIEVLIAISLLSLLLGTFFFWYRTIVKEKQSLKTVLNPILEERYCDIRLSSILPKIKKEKEPIFFTRADNLVFTFDHGPHIDPLLSNTILGCLFHDKNNDSLCLSIWPHPQSKKQIPTKTFVLLEHISELSFFFYYPPEQTKKVVNPEEIGDTKPSPGWHKEWKKEYKTLPAMIKICVHRKAFEKEGEIEFIYSIEEGEMPFCYPGKM